MKVCDKPILKKQGKTGDRGRVPSCNLLCHGLTVRNLVKSEKLLTQGESSELPEFAYGLPACQWRNSATHSLSYFVTA